MDLFSIYNLLLKKKWYIIFIPILTGVLALFLSGLMKKQYKSVAKLSTGFTQQSSINLDDERFNYGVSVFQFSNLVETMKSEMILSMVSYNLLSHDLNSGEPFRFNEDSIEFYKESLDLSQMQHKKDSFLLVSRESVNDFKIKDLLDHHGYSGWQLVQSLFIGRVRDTDYVTVEFVSENPHYSAFVVNNIADELIRYYTYTNSLLSNKSVDFFQGEVDKKKSVLDNALSAINIYKVTNPVRGDPEKAALITKLIQYEMLKDESIKIISTLQYSLLALDEILNTSAASDDVAANQRIVDLRNRLNQLTVLYIESGSNDANLEQTINNVKTQLAIEMKYVNNSGNKDRKSTEELLLEKNKLELDLRVERANLERINEQIINTRVLTESFASESNDLSALEHQLDDAMAEYQSALDKLNLEKSKSLLTESSVTVAVRGQPKLEPESRKRKVIILFAMFTSLALTVIAIVGFDLLDVRIKTGKDFDKNMAMPLLGQLNKVALKKFRIGQIFKSDDSQDNETYKQLLRKIRHNIEQSSKKCLVVTSLNKSDGKTFTILSLSYSLSLIKKKILIIDTNFKNNTLTRLLAPNTKFKLLNSAHSYGDTLLIEEGGSQNNYNTDQGDKPSIMVPTIYKNIYIIGNNGGFDSPLELFSGKDFDSMLVTLKELYDYIILEGPAVNEHSDTMELVDFADGVLCVFEAGTLIKQKDQESISYLTSLNDKLVGGILNKIEPSNI